MVETCKSQIHERCLGEADARGESEREQRHVDRMVMCVFVVAAESGESENHRFILLDQVNDILDDPLGFSKVRSLPLRNILHRCTDGRHRFEVQVLGHGLRLLGFIAHPYRK